MSGASAERVRYVGCTGFGPQGLGLLNRVSLVEVQESFIQPPRRATLQRWRNAAPAGVCFSLRAWQVITYGPSSPAWSRQPAAARAGAEQCGFFQETPCVQDGYRAMLECAERLQAHVILFDTPACFTPTREHRRLIVNFFRGAARLEGVDMAWAPRGIWSVEEVAEICSEVDLVHAVDPLAAGSWPAGRVAYLKLESPHYSEGDILSLADGLEGFERAFCVFSGSRALRDAERLAAQLNLDEPDI